MNGESGNVTQVAPRCSFLVGCYNWQLHICFPLSRMTDLHFARLICMKLFKAMDERGLQKSILVINLNCIVE